MDKTHKVRVKMLWKLIVGFAVLTVVGSLLIDHTASVRADKGVSMHSLPKPLVWSRGKLKMTMRSIGRSESKVFGEQKGLETAITMKNVPLGFHLDFDTILATDAGGHQLLCYSYGQSGDDVRLAFVLPAGHPASLREVTGTLSDSYVSMVSYGPLSMQQLEKPIVFKDKSAALSSFSSRMAAIPYDMIAPCSTHLSADGESMESNVKKLPDSDHGYCIVQCCGLVVGKDSSTRPPDLDMQVYGSDGKWHDTFEQWSRVTGEMPDFESNNAFCGFTFGISFQSNDNNSAKIVRVVEPASSAGMQVGDIVTKLDNREVETLDDAILALVEVAHAGIPLPVTVLRDGQTINLKVVPAHNPIWDGLTKANCTAAGNKVGSLISAGKDSTIWALAFITPDPVSMDFRPIKVRFKHNETAKPTKTIQFRFRNVPIPAKVWK